MRQQHRSSLHLQMGQEIIYLLLMFSLVCNVLMITWVTKTTKQASTANAISGSLKDELEQTRAALERANRLLGSAQQQSARRSEPKSNDQPPIITLREADGFSFAAGSAEVTPEFQALLTSKIIPLLAARGEQYMARIVEVIGHTDGVVVSHRLRTGANLDDQLGPYLDGTISSKLVPYDNVGLGMSRAVSVSRALRDAGLPAQFDVQPLSASHLIDPADRTSPAPMRVDDASRRRIEIRLRRVGANRSG